MEAGGGGSDEVSSYLGGADRVVEVEGYRHYLHVDRDIIDAHGVNVTVFAR